MAIRNINDSTGSLKEFLDKYLVDPISQRASSWIYDDEGRVELDKSPFPKILIRATDTPSTKEINSLCDTKTFNTDTIEIQIKTKFGSHYGYGKEKFTAKEFGAYISEQIEDLLKDKNMIDELDDMGFESVLPVGDYFTYDQEKNPTFVMNVEVKYIS